MLDSCFLARCKRGGLPISKVFGATLYLSPNSGTFYVGNTFDISIFLNTNEKHINAVKVDISLDPKKLQLVNPTTGKSFISIWVAPPSYSNSEGYLVFQGGIPSPGINTSSGLVSTITFRAMVPGETKIQFAESSQILLDDGKGTNILNSLNGGFYMISILPPEGPKIFSSTHFDLNKWRKNNNPTFSWEKEEGVSDFSYSIDFDSQGVPDNISEGGETSVSYSNLEDGVWYFHIKAKKGEVWGGTSYYVALIDTTPPASFLPKIDPSGKTSVSQPVVSFITTDALSGIDHFEIKIIDITPERNKVAESFFIEASSPYQLPHFDVGKYMVAVRAYDKAGNWRNESVKMEIVPKGIKISGKGFWTNGMFLPWWPFLFLTLIILVLIFAFLIYRWKKHKSEKEARAQRLKEREKEMREHINKMNNLEQ